MVRGEVTNKMDLWSNKLTIRCYFAPCCDFEQSVANTPRVREAFQGEEEEEMEGGCNQNIFYQTDQMSVTMLVPQMKEGAID